MNFKTLTKLAATLVALGLATAATQAVTITLQVGTGATSGSGAIKNSTSPYVLGEFLPGVVGMQGAAVREAAMVNSLIPMSLGGQANFNLGSGPAEVAQRSLNAFSPLPTATDVGAVLVGQASGSGNFTAAVPAGGYTYYVAQWDGPNGGAMAYDIAGIAPGTLLQLPINAYGHGQTGGSFLKSGTPTSLPDGGATVVLLGLGIAGLGAMRRKLS